MSPYSSRASLRTAGLLVSIEGEQNSVRQLRAAAGDSEGCSDLPDVALQMEPTRTDFPRSSLRLVTRGVSTDDRGGVLVDSTGGSGYTQWWQVAERLSVRSTWAPSARERAAAVLMPARHRALRAEVLLHYPVLWWTCVNGMAPLHASVLTVNDRVVLLAGPGGIGKSTLVARELAAGAAAMCDNLAVCDGADTYGVAEPLRIGSDAPPIGRGIRATHGRREYPWPLRPTKLRPDAVVLVGRGRGRQPVVRPVDPVVAERCLVAGTFAAGELRRFWPLCGLLALATGRGPAVPPVVSVARQLTTTLPCLELALGERPETSLSSLLDSFLADLPSAATPLVGGTDR